MYRRFENTKVDNELMHKLMQQQNELSEYIKLEPLNIEPKIIAGADSSLISDDEIFSVFVIFKYPSLEIIEVKYSVSKIDLPYIPGFLGFREIPNLLKAYEKLENKPDIIFVDGNGIIHRKKLGIATHLGILLDKPTLGIAKNLLVGDYEIPGNNLGEYSPVIFKNEHIGFAFRSKTNVKPVFISPGHLMNLEDSLKLVQSVIGKYRLPEPTRIADLYSKKLKNQQTDNISFL